MLVGVGGTAVGVTEPGVVVGGVQTVGPPGAVVGVALAPSELPGTRPLVGSVLAVAPPLVTVTDVEDFPGLLPLAGVALTVGVAVVGVE